MPGKSKKHRSGQSDYVIEDDLHNKRVLINLNILMS